jgi:cell wall-associated NlpC family hydrolase
MGQLLKRAEIAQTALAWRGTPYHPHARILGVGVDCAQILIDVFERCEMVSGIEPGAYPRDWHLHRSEEAYIEWLTVAGAREVDRPDIGDVGLFRFGRTYSHSGIVVEAGHDPMVCHAYIGLGVIASPLSEEPLHGRAVRWWSLFPEA